MAARCLGRGVGRLLRGLRGVGVRALAAPRLWSSASAPAAPPGSYQERIALAAREPAAFWGPLARDALVWDTPYHTVSDCDFRSGRISWFLGGQLNVSVNCLDQHVQKSPESIALIWERDEPGTEVKITYRELLETTCRLANTLKRYGVRRGDRVAIYMPVSPLAVAAMLACARIGAIHNVIFAGFSAGSLAGRINDAQCKVVITFNQGLRGGRVVQLKKVVDEAIKVCPSVQHVLVAHRTDNKVHMGDLDVSLEQEMAKEEPVCAPESMGSEDTLFLLYTSGSTGKPKGLVHTQAGYLLYAAVTHRLVFDYRPGDVFGCVADIGWITGHSYVVYGPLCNGATSVLFESTPVYPNAGAGCRRGQKKEQRLGGVGRVVEGPGDKAAGSRPGVQRGHTNSGEGLTSEGFKRPPTLTSLSPLRPPDRILLFLEAQASGKPPGSPAACPQGHSGSVTWSRCHGVTSF